MRPWLDMAMQRRSETHPDINPGRASVSTSMRHIVEAPGRDRVGQAPAACRATSGEASLKSPIEPAEWPLGRTLRHQGARKISLVGAQSRFHKR